MPMDDQHEPPVGDGVPSQERPENPDWSSEPSTPVEHTRPLPPMPSYQQPASAAVTAPTRRKGAMTAAVMAGALLVGGAAGVGGAAWYDAWQGDSPPAASSATPAGSGVI